MVAERGTRSSRQAAATVGSEPLADVIKRRRNDLVGLVLESLVSDLTAYRSLPPELLTGDIAEAVERGLDLFLTTLATGRPLDEEELLELGESAARRAEERIPLAAVLRAYLTACRVVLDDVTAAARPDEMEGLVPTFDQVLAFLQVVTDSVVDRYVDENLMISDAIERADRSLLASLLSGSLEDLPPSTVLADSYVLLRLRVSEHPDELDPSVSGSIAARRKLRRLRSELMTGSPEQTLASLAPEGGVVLLAVAPGDPDGAEPERLRRLVARLSDAAGAEVHAAAVTATLSELPGAAALTAELIELAGTLDRPAGLHLLDDVVVEYQITRPGPARRSLASVITAIVDRPDLMQTLQRYLRSGLNRRQAALDLHVHPNTIDYRLKRVSELVGLDPTDRVQAGQLNAALLAHAAEAVSSSRPTSTE